MERHKILRVVTKILVPPILLFALYVQFHGDFGPGGGFQAFILYGLLFGVARVKAVAQPPVISTLAASGVLLYAGVGVVSMLRGANYLDYNVLSDDPVAGQHLGILIIELGVGITVASTMIMLFYAFGSRE